MSALLQQYIESLRWLSGAESVSIYLDLEKGRSTGGVLLHCGDAEPSPELADHERAGELLESDLETGATPPSGQGPFGAATSTDPACLLVCVDGAQEGSLEEDAPRLEGEARRVAAGREGAPIAWLGLRFATAEACAEERRRLRSESGGAPAWQTLLPLGGTLLTQLRTADRPLVDPTTGLPGRRAFHSVLESDLRTARTEGRSIAVLLINPDEFARVNEMLGRQAGDLVVRQVADGLISELREGAHLSRFGGVTFAIVLLGPEADAAREVADRLLGTLSRRRYGAGSATLGFSIGVACYRPGDAGIRHHGELVRRADQALHQAKEAGGGRSAEWEPFGSLLERLRSLLADRVRRHLAASEPPVPVGRWVADALLLRAERVADSAAASAELLRIPPSTFRRRFEKARSRHFGLGGPPAAYWEEVDDLLGQLVDRAVAASGLLEAVEECVLSAIESSCSSVALGAAYLGVSQPTYRKRRRQLQERGGRAAPRREASAGGDSGSRARSLVL